jgi:NAD(P)-dependent dehydrogenase (short-subunit alcohol dehydrogenase family)
MSKAAIENLTKYLAVYLAKREIRSNCVSPGGIEFKQGPKFKEAYTTKVPMGRMAQVNEISSTICFLLDEKRASYINGANIVVDGGFTSWR